MSARRTHALALAIAAPLAAAGCRTSETFVTPDPHLERMTKQEKRQAYDEDPLMPNGMAMLQPPPGTMPIDAIAGDPLLATGVADGRYAERIPVHVDRPLLEEGRRSFDAFCAACHGVVGDGESVVADKMALRKPPSLHEARIVAFAPGQLFATIRQGYGLMPSYSVQLNPRAAWAVVAYVRALQLARAAHVADLPANVRARLAEEAP